MQVTLLLVVVTIFMMAGILANYFGQKTILGCKNCQYCNPQTATQESVKTIEAAIQGVLSDGPANSRYLVETLNFTPDQITLCLQHLIDAGLIKINSKNQYYL